MKKYLSILLLFCIFFSCFSLTAFADSKDRDKKLTFWGFDFGTKYPEILKEVKAEFDKDSIATGYGLILSDDDQFTCYIEVDGKIKITKEFNAETISFEFVLDQVLPDQIEESTVLAIGKYFFKKQSESQKDNLLNLLFDMYGEPDTIEEDNEGKPYKEYTWTGFDDDCELILHCYGSKENKYSLTLEYRSNKILEDGMEYYLATMKAVDDYEESYNKF